MNLKLQFQIAVFACFALTLEAHAQLGTVNFANGAAQIDAPVVFQKSDMGVSGPDWTVELLLQSNTNLTSVAGPIPFESGSVAGYFFAGSVSIPATTPGQAATFKFRVSNGTTGYFALSDSVTVTLGGGIFPPANLIGLSYCLRAR